MIDNFHRTINYLRISVTDHTRCAIYYQAADITCSPGK